MVIRYTLKPTALAALLLLCVNTAWAGDIKQVLPTIKKLAADPILVSTVKEQNNKHLTLDQIKYLDEKWISTKGEVPEAKDLQKNKAAKVLFDVEKTNPSFKESILTDNQGANAAITELTSDYWQGDEPKFVKAFAEGKGEDYIARPKRDESTGQVISQVSVPIMDGGKAIGTLTIGVNLNELP